MPAKDGRSKVVREDEEVSIQIIEIKSTSQPDREIPKLFQTGRGGGEAAAAERDNRSIRIGEE